MSDSDDLRILVELAARGELSGDETAEVEALIANKPQLAVEYERLRSAPASAPTAVGPTERASNQSGCLLAFVGFVAALITVTIAGIVLMSRPDGNTPMTTDPIAAVLDDPGNEVLRLDGPSELTAFGRLALVYSPSTGDAALLGSALPQDGSLVGDDGSTLATFAAGDVRILIQDINPHQSFKVAILEPG